MQYDSVCRPDEAGKCEELGGRGGEKDILGT